MDREMIAERREEIEQELKRLRETIASLTAELDDLAAVERVFDRMDGKKVSVDVGFGDLLGARLNRQIVDEVLHQNWSRFLCKNLKVAGTQPKSSALLHWLAALDTTGIPAIDPATHPEYSSLAQLYDVSLPEKKPTMPEMITTAMGYLALRGEMSVTPKRVEETIESVFSPGPMSQNVNSVMWRMVKQDILVKDPDGPLYSLPKTNKAVDSEPREGASTALESNQAKGREAVPGGGT